MERPPYKLINWICWRNETCFVLSSITLLYYLNNKQAPLIRTMLITSETSNPTFQQFILDLFWFNIAGAVKRKTLLSIYVILFLLLVKKIRLLKHIFWNHVNRFGIINRYHSQLILKKWKSLLLTFITQVTIEAVCTTIKATSIKFVTRLVVTVWTARVPTVFSIRLDTFYHKLQTWIHQQPECQDPYMWQY